MRKLMITSEILECFEYSEDSPSGLIWKKKFSKKSGICIGDVAGAFDVVRSRWLVGINYKTYFTHRIVYLLHNPDFDQTLEVDHIDNNTNNNIISNLRQASRSENSCNRRISKANNSGYKHISEYVDRRDNKESLKYRTVVQKDGRHFTKITDRTSEGLVEAIAFRDKILLQEHKNFANVGQKKLSYK